METENIFISWNLSILEMTSLPCYTDSIQLQTKSQQSFWRIWQNNSEIYTKFQEVTNDQNIFGEQVGILDLTDIKTHFETQVNKAAWC